MGTFCMVLTPNSEKKLKNEKRKSKKEKNKNFQKIEKKFLKKKRFYYLCRCFCIIYVRLWVIVVVKRW